jgi:hypothetical protein
MIRMVSMNPKSVSTAVSLIAIVTFLTMAEGPSARAADAVHVRGTIVNLDGSTLTVKTREGSTSVLTLKSGWKVTGVATASADEIKPGDFVGIASLRKRRGETALSRF